MNGSLSLPVRRLAWPAAGDSDSDAWVSREWLVTNGLGGYASGTVAGVITRRYHGLLIAALPAPFGRTVMLSHLADEIRWRDGRQQRLGDLEWRGNAPAARTIMRSGGRPLSGSTISWRSPTARNSYGERSGSLTGASCARKFTDGLSAISISSRPSRSS